MPNSRQSSSHSGSQVQLLRPNRVSPAGRSARPRRVTRSSSASPAACVKARQDWCELLLDLNRRGLDVRPVLAIADGALGSWQAALRAQHWCTRPRNVPCGRCGWSRRRLTLRLHAFIESRQVKSEKAAECLNKDRDAADFRTDHMVPSDKPRPVASAMRRRLSTAGGLASASSAAFSAASDLQRRSVVPIRVASGVGAVSTSTYVVGGGEVLERGARHSQPPRVVRTMPRHDVEHAPPARSTYATARLLTTTVPLIRAVSFTPSCAPSRYRFIRRCRLRECWPAGGHPRPVRREAPPPPERPRRPRRPPS
jgi:hypothetical protein